MRHRPEEPVLGRRKATHRLFTAVRAVLADFPPAKPLRCLSRLVVSPYHADTSDLMQQRFASLAQVGDLGAADHLHAGAVQRLVTFAGRTGWRQ